MIDLENFPLGSKHPNLNVIICGLIGFIIMCLLVVVMNLGADWFM